MRARVVRVIEERLLDVNEDAEDVLPETRAVDVALEVPDLVFGLLDGPPEPQNDVGVVLLGGMHLAEDDVPNANLGGPLLDREFRIARCYSLDGMERANVARLDQGPQRVSR